jgi:hypothetical protein
MSTDGRDRNVDTGNVDSNSSDVQVRETRGDFIQPNATVTRLSLSESLTLDYTRIASNKGRAWVEVRSRSISSEPSTLALSDRYVLNSFVNGLSTFQDKYTLPPNRSGVVKLVSIQSSGIFLAVHEKSISSLAAYSGDRFAQNTDGSQVQDANNSGTKIAYDNELVGGYGTTYPDSVVEFGGRVYGFDAKRGEVWRYAKNGVEPIGSIYKMRTFFSRMGDQYTGKYDSGGSVVRNVVGGFDPNLNMYLLTFINNSGEGDVSETIGFIDRQGQERWVSFFDFFPERYATINNRMFSFYAGGMYEHNTNSTRNYFHYQAYSSKVELLMNSEPSHDKVLRNISTESSSPWSFTSVIVNRTGRTPQETLLSSSAFTRRDDVYYADVRRDKNTPGLSIGDALARGSLMIGKMFEVTMTNQDSAEADLAFVNFGYQKSDGHLIV